MLVTNLLFLFLFLFYLTFWCFFHFSIISVFNLRWLIIIHIYIYNKHIYVCLDVNVNNINYSYFLRHFLHLNIWSWNPTSPQMQHTVPSNVEFFFTRPSYSSPPSSLPASISEKRKLLETWWSSSRALRWN